ncbi:Tk-subtilisin [Drechslerella dactyloides]|uniref:Tk-subtilisin n=1 Tax=Drechslerella dactyloides TaxID=74499 RepID=A0AAD6IY73_DREDA|nr:Tk-subtilisin [Drechslerella dactyloides]
MARDTVAYAYGILASFGVKIAGVILDIVVQQRGLPSDRAALGADIATRLHLTSRYLEPLRPYEIEPDVSQSGQRDLKHSIVSVLRKSRKDAEAFKADCDTLYNRLLWDGPGSAEVVLESIKDVLPQIDYPSDINACLFKTLQSHSKWDSYLQNSVVSFDVFVSSMDMKLWQTFGLTIPKNSAQQMCLAESSTTADNLHPQAGDLESLLDSNFCNMLEEPLYTSISLHSVPGYRLRRLQKSRRDEHLLSSGCGESLSTVLQQYKLTAKDKIILANVIARAYWQFYDSELMQGKWTNENIWLMADEAESELKDRLPLRAYMAFQFDATSDSLEDFLDSPILKHQCPRIFGLGALLLEIGLGRPLGLTKTLNSIPQMNRYYNKAVCHLKELEHENWEGFAHKVVFDEAIRNCLESENYIQPPKLSGPTRKSQGVQQKDTEKAFEISKRRWRLYRKVIVPLAWLKNAFRNHSEGDNYIMKIKSVSSQETEGAPDTSLPQQQALFHTGPYVAAKNWLQHLKTINGRVEGERRRRNITKPVRIAILDTGCNPKAPFFLDEDHGSRRLACIQGWQDFVSNSESPVDEFGHGTLMTRLMIESAPSAKLLVARVARSTKKLDGSQEKIAEAIRWAEKCEADIVSMSFGFPKESTIIKDAIDEVCKKRNGAMIFLSSAGNSSYDDVTFPANDPAVIAIYATNCYGTFAATNPRNHEDGPHILGTFGDNISEDIYTDMNKLYPKVCEPGSSIATAIAAGIAATLLSYATVLSALVPIPSKPETFQPLWEKKGMEKMLHKISQDSGQRRRFINPISFWTGKDDLDRWCDMHTVVSEILRTSNKYSVGNTGS